MNFCKPMCLGLFSLFIAAQAGVAQDICNTGATYLAPYSIPATVNSSVSYSYSAAPVQVYSAPVQYYAAPVRTTTAYVSAPRFVSTVSVPRFSSIPVVGATRFVSRSVSAARSTNCNSQSDLSRAVSNLRQSIETQIALAQTPGASPAAAAGSGSLEDQIAKLDTNQTKLGRKVNKKLKQVERNKKAILKYHPDADVDPKEKTKCPKEESKCSKPAKSEVGVSDELKQQIDAAFHTSQQNKADIASLSTRVDKLATAEAVSEVKSQLVELLAEVRKQKKAPAANEETPALDE